MNKSKVVKIEEYDFEGFVYNIEVENNHNYFLNGVLVSNCHEKSSTDGKHGDIHLEYLNTLHEGTEIALGGGNLLEHPEYKDLLKFFKNKKVFCNITLHQTHVANSLEEIKELIKEDLVKGIGISFNGNVRELENLLSDLNYPHIVLHVINGLINIDDLRKISKFKNVPKLLILGYKTFGRGIDFQDKFDTFISDNKEHLQRNLKRVLLNFPVVSFDNLALEQLNLSDIITEEQYKEFYMGDDGEHTMYIDLVEKKFAKNSRSNIRYDILDNIDDMFKIV